jgi:hypothetical protein
MCLLLAASLDVIHQQARRTGKRAVADQLAEQADTVVWGKLREILLEGAIVYRPTQRFVFTRDLRRSQKTVASDVSKRG